jgi:hypothetical protein
MTFVCERCAEGLSAEEIDAEATHPDSELGGTDPDTGGHLCKSCVEDDKFDVILREVLVRKGLLIPTTVREVLIAEEAMKDEPPTELPERLRDPWELMKRHPEVFGEVKRK